MTLSSETNGSFAQRRFFNAKGLDHFGSCGTRGICSDKYPSNILAVIVLSLRSTMISKMLKLLWLKSSFAQKPLVSSCVFSTIITKEPNILFDASDTQVYNMDLYGFLGSLSGLL